MTAISDALITGAGSPHGIGIAIARCLAASGLKLAITSTSERVHERASEMRENGYQVRSFVGDLTDFAVAQSLAAEVGPVSILINNAGMGSIREPAVAKAFVEYEERDWDLVICDHGLPQFNSLAALDLLKRLGRPIPLIIVSGVISEDDAVGGMRAGAKDYITKGNLRRLVPAVHRELNEARIRQMHLRAPPGCARTVRITPVRPRRAHARAIKA